MTAPFRIGILIGHSLATPLEEGIELAKSAVNDFSSSGLAVDLFVDSASLSSLKDLANVGCDLLLLYVHGSEDGRLMFADGIHGWDKLSETEALREFWKGLRGVMLMACNSQSFAKSLPCPWLAFSDAILRLAPKGYVHALVNALKTESLQAAIKSAHSRCQATMKSNFLKTFQLSETIWPDCRLQQGESRIRRGSPALFGSVETDIASITLDGKLYPEHDPFVGRHSDLSTLFKLPSRLSDDQLTHRYWVSGDAGIGKSALLRQHACNIRDAAFADEEQKIWLLHAYCMNCVQPKDLEKLICEKGARLYNLETVPASLDQLIRKLAHVSGTHVWILDDLTYLRPELGKEQQASQLVQSISQAAQYHAIALQLVVSARFKGAVGWNPLEVAPLSSEEAVDLAKRILHNAKREIVAEDNLNVRLLFERCGKLTVHFKRALLLAVERQKPIGEVVTELDQAGLDALEEDEFSRKIVQHELVQLKQISPKHGFDYFEFLKVYFPIIKRAGHFSSAELLTWFPKGFRHQQSAYLPDRVLQIGLAQLVRLGFLATRLEQGESIYYLPPNQRIIMKALGAEDVVLPKGIPFRAPRSRLSIALERANKGELGAIQEILALENEYLPHISEIEAAVTVSEAMILRAVLCGWKGDKEAEIEVCDQIVNRFGGRPETEIVSKVAQALITKAGRLVQLNRSSEAIEVYDEVVNRFGECTELEIAIKVAQALFSKEFTLRKLNRCVETIDSYDEVITRLGERPEPEIAVEIARVLVIRGVRLRRLDRLVEAIEVYEGVASKFGERLEPEIAVEVARGLNCRGIVLGQLNRWTEAIKVFDDLVSRFGDRTEPEIAIEVAMAFSFKGSVFVELDCFAEAAEVCAEVVIRFGERSEPEIAAIVDKAKKLKGLLLEQLDQQGEADQDE